MESKTLRGATLAFQMAKVKDLLCSDTGKTIQRQGNAEREGQSRGRGTGGGGGGSLGMWVGRNALGISNGKDGLHTPCSAVQRDPAQARSCPHRDTTELMEL